jgi:hypothetical protein
VYLTKVRSAEDSELIEAARLAYQSLQAQPATIELVHGALTVDGASLDAEAPGLATLIEVFRTHHLTGVALGAGASNEDLRNLASALARAEGRFPPAEEWVTLMGAGASRIGVTREIVEDPLPLLPEAPQAEAQEDLSPFTGTRMLDLGQLDLPTPAAPAVSESPPVAEVGPSAPDPTLIRLRSRARAAQEAGSALAVLEVAKEFLDAELAAGPGTASHAYLIELRRLVTRRFMIEFARMAAAGECQEAATAVLHRLGAEAARVLMDELVKAESRSERRILFTMLSRLPHAADVVVAHLSHPSWFVVRNAADLCGEMRLPAAVPHLGRQAQHPEPRVRKSVAGALGRIGTPETVGILGQLLRDPDPAIRTQVLACLDGARARALGPRIAAMLSREEDPAVQRELVHVLIRMDTAEARQSLQRIADGEFRNLKRLRGEAARVLSQMERGQGATA